MASIFGIKSISCDGKASWFSDRKTKTAAEPSVATNEMDSDDGITGIAERSDDGITGIAERSDDGITGIAERSDDGITGIAE